MNVHDSKVETSGPGADFNRTKPQQSSDSDAMRSGQRGGNIVRRIAQVVLPLLVIAVGYSGYSYLKSTRPEKQKRPTQERVFAAKSIIAKKETIQPTLKLYGTTVSGRRVDIRALVSGRVIETSPALKDGGRVSEGELLLRIDPFGYQSALAEAEASLAESKARQLELEASITQDQAALEISNKQRALAETDLKRAEPLAKRGTVSKRTVDERAQALLQRQQDTDRLTNAIKVWRAKVAQQKAIIARQTATVALAQRRLDETELKAPFNAFVVEVTSQIGRFVGSNDKVATLIDRDWIEAKFTLSDEQFGRILGDASALEGRQIDVIWSLGKKEITYPATVERVAGQVNATTGGVEILARIKNPHKPVPLRSGAFVEVRVPDKTFVDVIRVPPTALYSGNLVYIIEQDRLQERKIEVVGAKDNDVLIKGPVASGDRILTTRVSTPGSGVRVREVE